MHAGYLLLGGAGVVAANAALAALLAVVVFRAARAGSRPALAGACTVLTVLALGPWLGLTPRLFSCLFLALIVLLMRRVADGAEAGPVVGRGRWLVPALIAVWANVDHWVVLGPLAVGLHAIVEWRRGRVRAARAVGWMFLAGLTASVFSPNHFHVWGLSNFGASGRGSGPAASPFWPAWYRTAPPAVGASYAVLALLGLVALVRDRQGQARAWAPLWVVLLALAAWSPAAPPFFAVVAGPTAALGLSGRAARRWPLAQAGGTRRGVLRLVKRGRHLLAPLAAVAVLAAAWPGWFTGPPYGRPAWSVDVDEPLRAAVADLTQWHIEGVFHAEGRGLTFSRQAADYWARFGPAGRGPLDDRSGTGDLAAVRERLFGGAGDDTEAETDWRGVLRAHRVTFLVLHADGTLPTEKAVARLAGSPEEWPLLYLRGRTVVFGWRDPTGGASEDRFGAAEVRVDRRAFRPAPADRAPPEYSGRGPGRRWSRAFLEPPPAPPPEQAEAALYLAYFDGQRRLYTARNEKVWLGSQMAGLVGSLAAPAPGVGPGAVAVAVRAIGVPGDWEAFTAGQDDGPLGALLLAVRSARRSVRANPDDAKSYFLLGEAYLRLTEATRERAWRHQLPAFDRIRQVQAITAFQHALTLRPDSPAAHGRLARLYRERGSFDLALHHLDQSIRVSRARDPQPGEHADTRRESLAALERERGALAEEVRRREEVFETAKGNRRALDLARDAAGLGLANRALDILLKSDASEFGPEGVRLELDLLLWAGRVEDVRAWLDPDLAQSIGSATYHEILACVAAATGNYREAGLEMRSVATALVRVPTRLPTPQTQAAYDIARAMLSVPFANTTPGTFAHTVLVREGLLEEVQQIVSSLRRERNALVVAGLLALEGGQIEEAEDAFSLALGRRPSWDGADTVTGLDFSGRRVAQDCLRLTGVHGVGSRSK